MGPPDGHALSTAAGEQGFPERRNFGQRQGRALLTWHDTREGFNTNLGIYAQRISANGTVQWTTDGVALSAGTGGLWPRSCQGSTSSRMTMALWLPGSTTAPVITPCTRSGSRLADRASGPKMALPVAALPTLSSRPPSTRMVGGAIIVWFDDRSGNDVYAQRISVEGTVEWETDGVAICTAAGEQRVPNFVSDGRTGPLSRGRIIAAATVTPTPTSTPTRAGEWPARRCYSRCERARRRRSLATSCEPGGEWQCRRVARRACRTIRVVRSARLGGSRGCAAVRGWRDRSAERQPRTVE